MSPQEKADRAKLLLSDPLLMETIGSIREALVSKLEAAGLADTETHTSVAISLQVLKQINSQLRRYLDDAAVIEADEKHRAFVASKREQIRPRH